MFCKNCGGELADGQTFCPYCGASISDTQNARPAAGSPAGRANTGQGMKITLFSLLGVAILFMGFALYQWVLAENGKSSLFSKSYAVPTVDMNDWETQTPALPSESAPVQTPSVSSPDPEVPSETPSASLYVPPSTSEATPGADTVFANDGFEMDVEAYLAETWWGSDGTSLDNPDAAAVASGYPKTYLPGLGEIQYIFYAEDQTVQMLTEDADGVLTDMGMVFYDVDPYGFYLYAFYRTVEIDGVSHELYSKFFVCDDILYEVEMMDGSEVSNYIPYIIYGP